MSSAIQDRYWRGAATAGRRPWHHPAVAAYARPKVDWILNHLGLDASAGPLLEVGAGSGHLTGALLEQGLEVLALDRSPTQLALNPSRLRVAGDALALPLEDEGCGWVVEANLLHHLDDPARAVAELARVAGRGVALVEPSPRFPPMAIFGLLKTEERGLLRQSRRSLHRWLEAAGLVRVASTTLGLALPNRLPALAAPLVGGAELLWGSLGLPGAYLLAAGTKPER